MQRLSSIDVLIPLRGAAELSEPGGTSAAALINAAAVSRSEVVCSVAVSVTASATSNQAELRGGPYLHGGGVGPAAVAHPPPPRPPSTSPAVCSLFLFNQRLSNLNLPISACRCYFQQANGGAGSQWTVGGLLDGG